MRRCSVCDEDAGLKPSEGRTSGGKKVTLMLCLQCWKGRAADIALPFQDSDDTHEGILRQVQMQAPKVSMVRTLAPGEKLVDHSPPFFADTLYVDRGGGGPMSLMGALKSNALLQKGLAMLQRRGDGREERKAHSFGVARRTTPRISASIAGKMGR